MSIDMTGLARLGKTGLDKVLTEIPRGQAKEGISFAFKVKAAAWVKGDKYGYMYHLDVVVRTLDMQALLGALLWKVYPSMLPDEITEAIDCDVYDNTWWLVRTEVNPSSKADPPRTRLHLIDTQQGLDAQQTGPTKPAATPGMVSVPLESSERGQPGAGGEPDWTERDKTLERCMPAEEPPTIPLQSDGMPYYPGKDEPPANNPQLVSPGPKASHDQGDAVAQGPPPATCSHENIMIVKEHEVAGKIVGTGFYCKDCGERVG